LNVKVEFESIGRYNRNKRNRFVYNPNFEGINELITLVTKLAAIAGTRKVGDAGKENTQE